MSFKGTVKNGVVVLPPEAKLLEGSSVEVIPAELSADEDSFLAVVEKLAKPRPHWSKDYTQSGVTH